MPSPPPGLLTTLAFQARANQVVNHQTHHRGQISLALETFGVKHHYSNLIGIE